MATSITAVFESGLLRPTTPLVLPEGARVELIIISDEKNPKQAGRSAAPIPANIAAVPTTGGDPRTCQDHDQIPSRGTVSQGQSMITAADMRKRILEHPFQPFRVYLTDGRQFDIHVPSWNLVGEGVFLIGVAPDDDLIHAYLTDTNGSSTV